MNNRNGVRKTRGQSSKFRKPQLGYYIIVTDTKDTEKNYLYGLHDSIPKELQEKLVIKVFNDINTNKLVTKVKDLASKHSQYSEPWIIFDRDQVENFNEIISEAEAKGIHVGWSNPCIEIWFSAYFGMMPTFQNSVECCKGFEKLYSKHTKQKYCKSDSSIYSKLCQHGNEENAISVAEKKYVSCNKSNRKKPSEMYPCTTVHKLIREIKTKIKEK